MKILIDAMGGDNAPLEIILGAAMARATLSADVSLVGHETTIRNLATQNAIDLTGIAIHHAETHIAMDDNPLDVRSKANCSIRIGMDLLREGQVDAFVSAGSTGALHLASSLFVRRIPGIHRSAIATIVPLTTPMLLLDSGANTVVTAQHLQQFARMGSIYMKNVMNIPSPRVGLLNNGTEACKGPALLVETHKILSEDENINFVGNIEGKGVPFDRCDVLVTDGFCGNILLKTIEGTAAFTMRKVKGVLMKNAFTKAGALISKKGFDLLKKEFDPTEYGGAPFLGIARPVIKAQGSSNANAIKNSIRQAIAYAETNMIDEIARLGAGAVEV